MEWAANRSANSEWLPLLTTKLHVARTRPNLVHRPRLAERLDEGLRTRLTLIAAPAGFGKTTLLSGWAQRSKQNVAWLSLDESDNVPVKFWAYFIGSLQRLQPGLGSGSLELLQAGQPVELALTALINELAAMPGEVAMVLDDYHHITLDSIHSTLSFFIERMPAQMHLFITGRIEPPIQLTRLRARGELIEIRDSELRFTQQEAASLFGGFPGIDLSSEEIGELIALTEGWAVALQLTGLAMQEGKRGGEGRISSSRFRYVAEYVFDEIMRRLPEETRQFLLRTSILERLNGGVCNAVTGSEDADSTIQKLLSANLFLFPIDGEPDSYRYHRLFAQVLRDRMEQTDHAEVNELHRRASQWFEMNGSPQEAVEHLIRSREIEKAVVLAEKHAETILAAGKLDALLRWRGIFPEEMISSRPSLALAFGWALLLTGQFESVEKYLEIGHRFAPPRPDTGLSDISGHVAAMENMLAGFRSGERRAGELKDDEESAKRKEDRPPQRGIPPVTPPMGVFTTSAHSLEKPQGSEIDVAIAPPQTRFSLHEALPRVAKLQFKMGKLRTATATYNEALDLLDEHPHQDEEHLLTAARCHAGLAEIDYERNAIDSAMHHLSEALRLGRESGDCALLRDIYLLLSQVHQTRGDLDGAADAIDEAEQILRKGGMQEEMLESLVPHRVRIWLALGQVQNAIQWAQKELQNVPDRSSDWYEQRQLALARILISRYRADDALEILTPLLQMAEARQWGDTIIRTLLLQGMALDQQGEAEQAVPVITRALRMAAPEMYLRTFVDEGGPMVRLLKRLRDMQDEEPGIKVEAAPGEYLESLLTMLGVTQEVVYETAKNSNGISTHPTIPAEDLPTPISDREIEVLKLIADGKSNASIADSLYISLSTVKTHINNLYSKLGVESRTQALARAREFNLI